MVKKKGVEGSDADAAQDLGAQVRILAPKDVANELGAILSQHGFSLTGSQPEKGFQDRERQYYNAALKQFRASHGLAKAVVAKTPAGEEKLRSLEQAKADAKAGTLRCEKCDGRVEVLERITLQEIGNSLDAPDAEWQISLLCLEGVCSLRFKKRMGPERKQPANSETKVYTVKNVTKGYIPTVG